MRHDVIATVGNPGAHWYAIIIDNRRKQVNDSILMKTMNFLNLHSRLERWSCYNLMYNICHFMPNWMALLIFNPFDETRNKNVYLIELVR